MFNLLNNVSLKEFNTFGIDVNARFFLLIESERDLISFFGQNKKFLKERRLVLGGGSNLLFLGNFPGIVIYPQFRDIRVISENKDTVEVEVGAGEVWDDFVDFCVRREWGGLENLSLIPGNVGAVPVQNIGAYGEEAESSILKVNAVNLMNLNREVFSHDDCHFGYRNSIFKNELRDQYVISSVVFRLKKNYSLNLSYWALKSEIGENTERLDLAKVRQAVISVRKSKLPDPKLTGNAGSFFENPIINSEISEKLLTQYPQIPIYPCDSDGFFKISAAWLIEKSGWKGKSYKNAAVHEKQALVLVNKGGATGNDIFELSELIKKDIFSQFGIILQREVNIIER